MGAWGAGSFSNDTALDYVEDLNGFDAVFETISHFSVQKKEPLDADDASIALAACDLLAIVIGRPPAEVPDIAALDDLKDQAVTSDQLKKARALIKVIAKSSELSELWAEDDDSEWQSALDDLLLRLTPSKPYKASKAEKVPNEPGKEQLPDDFLGYCYLCNEVVTQRDGILFEHTAEYGGTCSIHPHTKCIEEIICEPVLNEDGSPTRAAKKVLMQHMGFDV
ncbi:MAG: DUF4259 domain-containing protein [Lentilitoribacter sp.]